MRCCSKSYIISFFLLFFLLVLPLALVCGQEELAWVRSDSAGMAFESIGAFDRYAYDYVMSIARVQDSEGNPYEKRSLFMKNEMIREWNMYRDPGTGTISRIETVENGNIVQREFYSPDSVLISYEEIDSGSPTLRIVYQYEDSRLIQAVSTDFVNQTLWTDNYEYNSWGTGSRIMRSGVENRSSGFSFSPKGESILRLVDEWTESGSSVYLVRYTLDGRVKTREHWNGIVLVDREIFDYKDDVLISSRYLTVNPAQEIIRTYDRGVITSEKTILNGKTGFFSTFEYEAGKLVKQVSVHDKKTEEWEFSYNGSGNLVTEIYSSGGLREKMIDYDGSPDQVIMMESLYVRGILFLQIHYENGKKAREDFIKDGTIIRSRSLLE